MSPAALNRKEWLLLLVPLIPSLVAAAWFIVQANAWDFEVNARLAPMEAKTRLDARKNIRILSEKIIALDKRDDLTPAEKAELKELYAADLMQAQDVFDQYDED